MQKRKNKILPFVLLVVLLFIVANVIPDSAVSYTFRTNELLQSHFEKHGIDMGFADAAAYEKAASDVINNPLAEHKSEKEDGDLVYYIEETNEFVILSKPQNENDKGYIRTYFLPDDGRDYYDRQ